MKLTATLPVEWPNAPLDVSEINIPPTMLRYNEGKTRWGLLPILAHILIQNHVMLRDLAAVYTFGAIKYDDNNWRKGGSWLKVLDSAMRHVDSVIGGETHDTDSTLDHRGHIAWNIITLMYFDENKLGMDDTSRAFLNRDSGNEFDHRVKEAKPYERIRLLLAAFADTGEVYFLRRALNNIEGTYE